jgi:hypothetical protein
MSNIILTLLLFLVKINILHTESFRLDTKPIAPIYWIDKTKIFVNEDNRSYIFDTKNREIIKEYNREENQLFGMKKGKLYLCEWENREISSIDQYSTHLKIKEFAGRDILDIELKPTLEVVKFGTNPILKTVFPIEEKFFIFNKDLYELDKYNINTLSPNLKSFIRIDNFDQHWIEEFKIF